MSYTASLISRIPELGASASDIEKMTDAVEEMARRGGKLIMCGNGGSASDCLHIAGELLKDFMLPRPLDCKTRLALADAGDDGSIADGLRSGIAAIALPAETAAMTAFANDADPTLAYAQLTLAYARPGDLFLGISTSGNSKNVCAAAITAKACGIGVLSLTGLNESKLSALSDICVRVPSVQTYRVQEYHLAVYHAVCAEVEVRLFR